MRRSVTILLFLPVFLAAQEKKNLKPGWKTIAAAGFSVGESGAGAVFQLSGGITYGSFFTGIGMGYDRYRFKSFPLFADWRMSLGRRQLMYIYAMPGYNIPGKFTREVGFWGTTDEKMQGGFYMETGLGYRLPLGARHRLAFSAGYLNKSMVLEKSFRIICCCSPCPSEDQDITVKRYNFGVITTKISWEWGR